MEENLNLIDMVEETANNEEEDKSKKEREVISEYEKILGY